LMLTGCGFGGGVLQATSAAQPVNRKTIGIVRNIRIVSLRTLSAFRPVQCLETGKLFFIGLRKFVAE
jgi:hypothetical protein